MIMSRFVNDEGGQDIVEYSLLLTLVATIALLAVTMLGVPIRTLINSAATRINAATDDSALPN